MPKKSNPANYLNRILALRMVNFILAFAITGVLYLVFSQAGTPVGLYGTIEKDQVTRINAERSKNGKPALQHIECLNALAENWTKKMVAAGKPSHNPNLGNEVSYACGSQWNRITENVAVGYYSDSLFKAFMSSTAHKANILDGAVNKIGVGAYHTSDGKLWITHIFANCTTCTTNWTTNATLPADPKAAATGNGYFIRNSNSGGASNFSFNYGNSSDLPVFCDWNNDGRDTIGLFRSGTFYLSDVNGTTNQTFSFGTSGDIPICGDWNNDGFDSIGVYRPSTSFFYLRNSNSSGTASASFQYGNVGDKPLAGDWDGNGTDTIGVRRNATFLLRNSNSAGSASLTFDYANSTDTPLAGDWDGNGTTTVGVWRSGTFFMRNSNSAGTSSLSFSYGISTDKPVVGDWDGNKTTTIGIKR